jgi:thiamine phosphate synthase YjbQ (UPF0047 family)
LKSRYYDFRKDLLSPSTRRFVDITPQLGDALGERGIREGLRLVNATNITSSVFINDDESGLRRDCERWLERLGFGTWGRFSTANSMAS